MPASATITLSAEASHLGLAGVAAHWAFKGISWAGAETAVDRVPFGLDKHSTDYYAHVLKSHGFNAVKILFSHLAVLQNVKLAPTSARGEAHMEREHSLLGLTYVEAMLALATTLQNHGLVVVLGADNVEPPPTPRRLWYTEGVPIDMIRFSWECLSNALCPMANVVGVDLGHWPASDWGSDSAATDWRLGAEALGNHVLAHCPRWLILVPGVGDAPGVQGLPAGANAGLSEGENLQGAGPKPVRLLDASKLVYAPRVEGPKGSTYRSRDEEGADTWQRHFGFLTSRGTQAPVAVTISGGAYRTSAEVRWHDWAMSYAAKSGFGVFYDSLTSRFAGDDEPSRGILLDDGNSPDEDRLASMQRLPNTDVCALGLVGLRCREPPDPPPPPNPPPWLPPGQPVPKAPPIPPPPWPPTLPGLGCLAGRTQLEPRHTCEGLSPYGAQVCHGAFKATKGGAHRCTWHATKCTLEDKSCVHWQAPPAPPGLPPSPEPPPSALPLPPPPPTPPAPPAPRTGPPVPVPSEHTIIPFAAHSEISPPPSTAVIIAGARSALPSPPTVHANASHVLAEPSRDVPIAPTTSIVTHAIGGAIATCSLALVAWLLCRHGSSAKHRGWSAVTTEEEGDWCTKGAEKGLAREAESNTFANAGELACEEPYLLACRPLSTAVTRANKYGGNRGVGPKGMRLLEHRESSVPLNLHTRALDEVEGEEQEL